MALQKETIWLMYECAAGEGATSSFDKNSVLFLDENSHKPYQPLKTSSLSLFLSTIMAESIPTYQKKK